MPETVQGGVTLHYDSVGAGETVAFVGEAGYGAWQWGWQYDHVAGPFEALVWDLRGTGRSDAPPGPYDVDTMVDDLEAVLAATRTPRVHLVGAGLGGMVALRYTHQHDRARTLSLFGTAPAGRRVDEAALRGLYAPADDPDALETSLSGALSPAFLERTGLTEQLCEWRAEEDADREAFEAQVAAALGFDAEPLYEVGLPALVCHGLDDPVVPAGVGQDLAGELPYGTFEAIEGRHLCFAEHSRAVSDRLLGFLDEHSR